MKLGVFGSVVGLAVVLACCSAGCSEETILRVSPAVDGARTKADARGAGACTPGATVDCTCPNGDVGKTSVTRAAARASAAAPRRTSTRTPSSPRARRARSRWRHTSRPAPDGANGIRVDQPGRRGSSNIGYVFSRDGGATWTAPKTTGDADGRESSDPVVAADPQGNFYVTWISFRRDGGGQPSDFVLYVAKAAAGQSTFGTPVEVDTFRAATSRGSR